MAIVFANVRVIGDLDRVSVEDVGVKFQISNFERKREIGRGRKSIETTFSSFVL